MKHQKIGTHTSFMIEKGDFNFKIYFLNDIKNWAP